ncbi:MAG: sulfate reduction electron transfer complex DsrMKJOP subunit DsrP [Planctomycetota bacterium]|jgi:molybdopterin-containing oxidoreductase family membrane subunit
MLEKALKGSPRYYAWICFLMLLIGVGTLFFLRQLSEGLQITGMSRDVTWGFYIAQFTFMVGVAASAVMVVLPYYLHNAKAFGKLTILGEYLAIPAVIVCMLCIFVDLGQPMRIMNVFLHPSPKSLMFWDTLALGGYLVLNVVIAHVTFGAERKGIAPPKWIKPIIILSIPWAISIHTVTAFLYQGLEGRGFWMTAILAPRFLASAFSSGPALLILLVLIVRKVSKFNPGKEPLQKLGLIITYAMTINVFFILMEIFTAFYSGVPEHLHHFQYLFWGYHGYGKLVPYMWTSVVLAVVSLVLLLTPALRRREGILAVTCVFVIISIWIDKGLGMVTGGFVPSPTGHVTEYFPTFPEVMITVGVYAVGALILTGLYKIAISVREEIGPWEVGTKEVPAAE